MVYFRLILPIFVRILEHKYYICDYYYEYFITVGLLVFYLFIYRWNMLFLNIGVIDFKRKLFYMKILQSMISVEKDDKFAFSTHFPTLNITWVKNLGSWVWLRQAWMDLGKKYTIRIHMYLSVFLGFYLLFLTFMLLVFFDVLQYELPLTLYITGMYDILLSLFIIFCTIKAGADVNEYFEIFKGIFIKQK